MTLRQSAPTISSSTIRCSRQPRTSIHILDDDSLLNLFSLFRPSLFEENQDDSVPRGNWLRERWWYKLVHVCQRWRYLILGSVSHLGLCLVCTRGTPVADMLTRSPPLPLIIGFEDENHGLTAEDEEGIMLALQHRNRVRRIYFRMPVPSLQKLIKAMDGGFPTLELLQIGPPVKPNTYLTLPSTFEAPQLRHLILDYFNSPIGSPFLTSAVGLVTLLCRIHPSTYFHPNRLLQTLSLLPQLERLEIGFLSPIPNRERQLLHTPITTQVTLPNLRRLSFRGISAYFDAFLPHMTTPLLESLSVYFFNQLSFYIPGILQFMSTTENLNFTLARLLFYHEAATVFLYSRVGTRLLNFYFEVICRHFDWQVFSVAQVFNTLRPLFSSVVDLMLDYTEHSLSPEWHNDVDPTQWRELLGAFRNVRTLHFHSGLIFWTFRALRWDGKPLLEPLPRLELLNDADPVRVLNNFLQEAMNGINFVPFLRFSSEQEGPNNQAMHNGTYTLGGEVLGRAKANTKRFAKRGAAAQALQYLLTHGIPE